MSSIESRRDLVVDLYLREGLTLREIEARLGCSRETARRDLRIKGVPLRPRWNGLEAHWRRLATPEVQRIRHQRFRAEVKRVKRELGLSDTHELLKRLRFAGVPRTEEAIRWRVGAGLLERVHGLPFDKPWLFAPAAVDELIQQLRDDGRYQHWNGAAFRLVQARSQFGLKAARREGGWATIDSPRSHAARELERQIVQALSAGMTRSATAQQVNCTDEYVRQVAKRAGLPPGRPGRPRAT